MVATDNLDGKYGGERYYMGPGLDYMECVPFVLSNLVHPLLARNSSGLSLLLHLEVVAILFELLTLMSLFAPTAKAGREVVAGFMVTTASAIKLTFVETFDYHLLDPVAVGFASLITYHSLLHSNPAATSLLLGAALASRLLTAYPFTGFIASRLWERD